MSICVVYPAVRNSRNSYFNIMCSSQTDFIQIINLEKLLPDFDTFSAFLIRNLFLNFLA